MADDFSLRTNVKEITKKLDGFAQTQVPFATALALTAVARNVAMAEQANIKEKMPTATPFTLNSVGVVPANKSNLTATVFVRDTAARYLAPFEEGGQHQPWKGKQAIFDPVDIGTNQYGNIPRSTIARLLKRRDVFMGEVRGVLGIWQRPTKPAAVVASKRVRKLKTKAKAIPTLGGNTSGKLKLLVYIGRPLQVTQHLGYRKLAERVIHASFNHEFTWAMARAQATAR